MHNNFAQLYNLPCLWLWYLLPVAQIMQRMQAKWGFEQAFWVVLFVTLVVAAGAWMKHALSTAIVTVVIGGILAYLCKQPEVISIHRKCSWQLEYLGDDYG